MYPVDKYSNEELPGMVEQKSTVNSWSPGIVGTPPET